MVQRMRAALKFLHNGRTFKQTFVFESRKFGSGNDEKMEAYSNKIA